jgi:hypothetical protein
MKESHDDENFETLFNRVGAHPKSDGPEFYDTFYRPLKKFSETTINQKRCHHLGILLDPLH